MLTPRYALVRQEIDQTQNCDTKSIKLMLSELFLEVSGFWFWVCGNCRSFIILGHLADFVAPVSLL